MKAVDVLRRSAGIAQKRVRICPTDVRVVAGGVCARKRTSDLLKRSEAHLATKARFRRPDRVQRWGSGHCLLQLLHVELEQSGEPPVGEAAHEVLGQLPPLPSALHRRRYPIATDNDDRCLPCAIALLLPARDEHMRACLQIGLTASDKVDDFGVARDDNGLLAILVFDLSNVGCLDRRHREMRRCFSDPAWASGGLRDAPAGAKYFQQY